MKPQVVVSYAREDTDWIAAFPQPLIHNFWLYLPEDFAGARFSQKAGLACSCPLPCNKTLTGTRNQGEHPDSSARGPSVSRTSSGSWRLHREPLASLVGTGRPTSRALPAGIGTSVVCGASLTQIASDRLKLTMPRAITSCASESSTQGE